MKNKITFLRFILGIILFFSFILQFPKPAFAMFADGGGSSWGTKINVYAYNDGTTWATHMVYFRTATGETFTTTKNSGDYWDLGFTISSNDTLKWLTACVDPESNITTVLNVSCRSYDAYSTSNCQSIMNTASSISCGVAYGACGGPLDYPSAGGSGSYSSYADNLGTIGFSTCPIPNAHPGRDSQSDENRFRCAYKGVVSSASTVGCRNTCTYRNCTSGGNWQTTAYSNKCGGSNITNTYMCSAWSATCSPPAPTVTATAVCNGANPNINVNYSANSGTPGNRNYDLRWKKSTDSWGGSGEHDICSPPTSGTGIDYTITSSALENNTTYNVQVREHTDSGYNGPTNFGSDTITTSNCGSIISGNVYVDSDNDGVKNSNYTGGTTTTLSNGTTDVTDGSGNYSFAGVLAGTYTVSLPASITGYYIPTRTSTSLTVPGDKAYNFRLVPLTTLTIHTYNDFNGNGVEDASDTPSSGRTVTVTGGGAGPYTTNTSGNVVLSNLLPNSSGITVSIPSGWTSTTTNPRGITYPPTPITVNFGIKPPAPTCSSLTANPTSVSPGGTSTLTCNNPTSPTGDNPIYTYYDDSTIAGDSVTNNNTNTSTWTAPNPYWIQDIANPSVSVCNPGGLGAACSNYQTAITIVPKFSISGNVFVDQNKDGLNAGDANYSSGTSTIQIRTGSCGGPLIYTASTANGIYTTGLNLPGGTYYVCYTSLPVGYKMTNPVNGPPASFSVRVGNASTGGVCSESSNSATCDANGNITNLNYGITNSIPWIQTTGGDPYSSNGVSNPIPSGASCGPYMSLRGPGGFPGVVYIGNGSADLGAGQASQNPYNWIAGGLTYPEVYTPKNAELKTSYNTMYNTALRSGITPTPLGVTQCGLGGTTNCALSGTLANGVYIVANGNLNLTGGSYTFPANKDFVILVNGDLNISTEIHVPIGSSALFSITGNINVANNVGEAVVTSTRANVEGYYSADRNFYAKSLDANGNGANCPTSDRRLNIAGSVVVNAKLQGGSFVNQRDLCAGDLQCPASTVIERPDFILNAPDFLKTTRRVWQEIAP